VLLAGGMAQEPLIHREISEVIIGAAMKVLNTLKPGLDEKAYENALVVELQRRARRIDQQKRFEVRYEGVLVDILVPDLIVDGAVIADPKVVEEFTKSHIAKMEGYLSITNLRLALLLNFKFADLRWKRVIR
jgi:GxxExxY protein